MRTSGLCWLAAVVVLLAGCGRKPGRNVAEDLHRAASSGDLGQVQSLIARGISADARGWDDGMALHDAARSGHEEVAEVLIRCGACIDSVDNQGRTPVSVAMERDCRAVVEYLVRAGAAVNLHVAAYLGDTVTVQSLIDSGADVTAKDRNGCTPLHYAASYGYRDVAKLLIAAAANLNDTAEGKVRQRDYVSGALFSAIREGHEDMAELLIDSGVPIAVQGDTQETPLYWAAQYGRLRAVKLLLAKGASINASTREGRTPLGTAIEHGYIGIVETLIAAGADVNVRDKSGRTLLMEAVMSYCEPAVEAAVHARYGDSGPGRDAAFDAFARGIQNPLVARMVALLVAHGADVNEKDEIGMTPLHHAAERGLKEAVEYLLAKGGDVNTKTTRAREQHYETRSGRAGTTPLHMAAASGDANTVKVLLAHGAELEARDQAGETPLHYAVPWGNPEVIEVLIAQGADVNAADSEGVAPLLGALLRGHLRTARVLIAAGATKVDVKDHSGKTRADEWYSHAPLLHEALSRSPWMWRGAEPAALDEGAFRREWIELLLSNGADPNEKDDHGNTPLHSAILLGDDESARLFIARGTDVNARNKSNIAALHHAAKDNRAELASVLLAKGADVNARDNGGDTPLHTAALHGQKDVIKVLLAHRVDVNAKNSRGRTPADEASRRGHKDIVRLLTAKPEGTSGGIPQGATKK